MEGRGCLNPKGGGLKPLLKTSTVVTGQQNGGETRLDFLNGGSIMMLETILDLLPAKLNGKK
jgi:hypothetical protein